MLVIKQSEWWEWLTEQNLNLIRNRELREGDPNIRDHCQSREENNRQGGAGNVRDKMKINTIYQGNVIVELQKIPDECIDLIITSPPYNVGMPYGTDDRKNYQEYLLFVKKWLIQCFRVLKTGCRLAINLPSSILQSSSSRMAYLSLDYVLLMREVGFLDREWITWIKMPRGEIPAKSTAWGSWKSPSCPYLRNASEFIIVMDKKEHKRKDKKGHNDITSQEFLTFTSNCWYFPPEHNRTHPAPFPEELPFRLVKLYSWQNDIILDPFIGSGTTAVVCKKLGRNYIGIDINPDYVKMTKERLEGITIPML